MFGVSIQQATQPNQETTCRASTEIYLYPVAVFRHGKYHKGGMYKLHAKCWEN